MAEHKRRKKLNIPMCIACILFCLTLFSVHLTSGLYARYTTADNENDSARVITFGQITLTETGDFGSDGKLMIIPGVNLEKKAVVCFAGSEAAAYVFTEVTLSSDWKTEDYITFSIISGSKVLMQWKLDEGWKFLQTDGAGKYIYYRELASNTPLTADIIADGGRVHVSEYITKSEISGMTGISITFRAAVVQSNGFESPAAAWEAMEAK